jgi:hypothetical protein
MCGHLQRERRSLEIATQFNINAVLHPERSARYLRGIYRELAVKRRNSIHRVRLQSPKVGPLLSLCTQIADWALYSSALSVISLQSHCTEITDDVRCTPILRHGK